MIQKHMKKAAAVLFGACLLFSQGLGIQAAESDTASNTTEITEGAFLTRAAQAVVKAKNDYDAQQAAAKRTQTIANAAIAQVGVSQDCTMLATNALAAAGINFHGWPYEYASLGEWTSEPVPGDLIIYSGHIAVYIGDGQAVHGGWNGYTTVISSVYCANALIGYIHVA